MRIFLDEMPLGHDHFITRIGKMSDVGPTICIKHLNVKASTPSQIKIVSHLDMNK